MMKFFHIITIACLFFIINLATPISRVRAEEKPIFFYTTDCPSCTSLIESYNSLPQETRLEVDQIDISLEESLTQYQAATQKCNLVYDNPIVPLLFYKNNCY